LYTSFQEPLRCGQLVPGISNSKFPLLLPFEKIPNLHNTRMTRESVGDFYVHLLHGVNVEKDMTSSTKLLTNSGMPSVIHFYDGG